MHAADIMTSKVLAVAPEATIDAAMRLMLDSAISGLPVVDAGGRLVGMVSEGDFLRRAELGTERRRPRWLEILLGPGRIADDYAHSRGRKVAEVMTQNVASVAENTPVADLVRLMERRRIKRVPVLRDGALVGIVTRANLLRALASIAAAVPAPAGDRVIRERLLAELERQSGASFSTRRSAGPSRSPPRTSPASPPSRTTRSGSSRSQASSSTRPQTRPADPTAKPKASLRRRAGVRPTVAARLPAGGGWPRRAGRRGPAPARRA